MDISLVLQNFFVEGIKRLLSSQTNCGKMKRTVLDTISATVLSPTFTVSFFEVSTIEVFF